MAHVTRERVLELFDVDVEAGTLHRKAGKGGQAAGSLVIGNISRKGYARISIDRRLHMLHRVVWLVATGEQPRWQIDHINGDKLDNRIANLRDVPQEINQWNRVKVRADSTTGIVGVAFVRGARPWRAAIRTNGVVVRLGSYATPKEASDAYWRAKERSHGRDIYGEHLKMVRTTHQDLGSDAETTTTTPALQRRLWEEAQ